MTTEQEEQIKKNKEDQDMQAKQQLFNEIMYNNTHSKVGPMIQSEFYEFATSEFTEMKGNGDFKNSKQEDSIKSNMTKQPVIASIFHTYLKAKIPEPSSAPSSAPQLTSR